MKIIQINIVYISAIPTSPKIAQMKQSKEHVTSGKSGKKYFVLQHTKIYEQKQKFMNAFEKFVNKHRAEQQSIVEIKNELIQRSLKFNENQAESEKKFYQVLLQKNELENSIRKSLAALKSARQSCNNSAQKQLENQKEVNALKVSSMKSENKALLESQIKAKIDVLNEYN